MQLVIKNDLHVNIRRQSADVLPLDFAELACLALDEDVDFIAKFMARWNGRNERFSRPGEGLFGAWTTEANQVKLVGIAGVMQDPYLTDPTIARLRHVYVAPLYRGYGIAEALVAACLTQAQGHFATIRLNAIAANAARLYERLGFLPVSDGQRATHILPLK